MVFGSNTEVIFRENNATEYGGAINVISTPLIGDIRDFFATERDCFFLYSSTNVSKSQSITPVVRKTIETIAWICWMAMHVISYIIISTIAS